MVSISKSLLHKNDNNEVQEHYNNKIQQNATVCRYLFTEKLLYMFRWYDLYQKLHLQFYLLLMMDGMTPGTYRVILQ